MLTAAQVEAYQRSRRPDANTSVLCHAPFVALNFDQSGAVSVCCYNRRQTLGSYPAQSLDEIWRGAPLAELRQQFLQARESPGCQLCFHQIAEGAFANALARNFDVFACEPDYRPGLEMPPPQVLEFEISNACNLECVMCSGHWSSRIRANREHLPPLANPYDDAFVEQLGPFLRGLRMAKFLGGEPFLVRRYYQIWERLRELNPRVQISVTTNATALPARAKAMLEALDTHVTVSIDAVTKTTYEAIRRNAHFETVMENLDYLHGYALARGTGFSLVVCPMTLNWRELPEILAFAAARERVTLSFNTVVRPPEVSLWSYSSEALAEVVDFLARQQPPRGDEVWTRDTREHWEGLVHQLEGWRNLRRQVEARRRELPGPPASWERIRSFALPGDGLGAAKRMARHLAGFESSSLTDVPEMSAALLEEEIDEQSVNDLDGVELRIALYLAERMVHAEGDSVDESRVREDVEYLHGALDALARSNPDWAVTLTEDLRDKVRRGFASLASEEVVELAHRWRRARERIAQPGARFAEAMELLAREPELGRALACEAPPEDLLRALVASRETSLATPKAERNTLAHGLLTLPTDDMALAFACVHLVDSADADVDAPQLARELAFLRGEWPAFEQHYWDWARGLRENLERGRFDRGVDEVRLFLEPWQDARERLTRASPLAEAVQRFLAAHPRVAEHWSSCEARERALGVVSRLRDPEAEWTLPARPAHVFPMGPLAPMDVLAACHVVGIVLDRAQADAPPPLDETFLGIELRALARRLRIWRTKHGESFPQFEADLRDHFERGDAAWCAEQCARLLATRTPTWDERLYRMTRGLS